MIPQKHTTPTRFAKIVIVLAGLAALSQCLPGFRPKHVRDIVMGFATLKGAGIFIYFAALSLLLPAARRLREKGVFTTVAGGLFVILSALLTVDLFFGALIGSKNLSVWALRAAYLTAAIWGFADRRQARGLIDGARRRIHTFWSGLPGPWWKTFLALVAFFLVRQEMHLYIYRLTVMGDELSWWYTGAKYMMNEGLAATMKGHGYGYYTPAIPWLISLPNRLIGAHVEEWLWGFPLFAISSLGFLAFELATTAFGFLAGFTAIFFTFLVSRDLMHMFGALFYGEAISATLTGILAAHFYLRWRAMEEKGQSFASQFTVKRALGLGLFGAFCWLAKPPLAALIPMITAVIVFYGVIQRRPAGALALAAFTVVPYQLWKIPLTLMGRTPEYSVKFSDLAVIGVDLSVPLGMIAGLFIYPGTPQSGYTYGLIIALALVITQGRRRLLLTMLATLTVYWGFVFGLYATFWQRGELGSAGRYLSHAALGLTCLLPLAFGAGGPERWPRRSSKR